MLYEVITPSRYCESDRFGSLARDIVNGLPPGYDQVLRINDWIRDSVWYMSYNFV